MDRNRLPAYSGSMKWLDLPPVWLVLFICLAWLSPLVVFLGPLHLVGWLCLFSGGILTLAAAAAFRSAETTIIPRRDPSALITTGVFRLSRNPIYLADVLFLLGVSLILGRLIGLLLVPVFIYLLDRRFIQGEEARLHAAFGPKFEDYAAKTRRWI